jgi:protein-tyrosine phosphatase
MAKDLLDQAQLRHDHLVWKLSDTPAAPFLSEDLINVIKAMNTTILVEKRPCLVHCAQGSSRSAAVCAAWLMQSNKAATLCEAMDCIRRVRPKVNPNLGFVAALKAIETTIQQGGSLQDAVEKWEHRKQTSYV